MFASERRLVYDQDFLTWNGPSVSTEYEYEYLHRDCRCRVALRICASVSLNEELSIVLNTPRVAICYSTFITALDIRYSTFITIHANKALSRAAQSQQPLRASFLDLPAHCHVGCIAGIVGHALKIGAIFGRGLIDFHYTYSFPCATLQGEQAEHVLVTAALCFKA
eukprot:6199186-Pleurochrysis_carterae.AAC.1